MGNMTLKLLFVCFVSFYLIACTTAHDNMTPKMVSELQQGKRYFEAAYYRRAMSMLLPLAYQGSAEAQYAVGYMYYNGYGVARDPDVGYFWIKRAADKGYLQALQALPLIEAEREACAHISHQCPRR